LRLSGRFCVSKCLSLFLAVVALAVGAPGSAGAATLAHHPPTKHAAGGGKSSSGKGRTQQKSCHNLPCW
jgi:hypothetical protein